jgi:amino acid transporter
MSKKSKPIRSYDHDKSQHGHKQLGQLPATAICGNDITSSCLYVSGLVILQSGRLAPFVLLVVAFVLFLYRSIYAEVVGALPLNGGAYNALLNTTSKFRASIAACLTILSYMATAVISANEAMHYAHSLWHDMPVFVATIILLGLFMCLTIIGITESAIVAIGIFLFHMVTLVILILACGWFLFQHGFDVLHANFQIPETALPGAAKENAFLGPGILRTLLFGFAAGLLGISGFESSANFVEEQKDGVFPKTLRNMWIAVSFFNPIMAFLVLAVIPISVVSEHKNNLLSYLGGEAAGGWLLTLVAIDAVLVLSGAVLTSFVGVTGLVRRMSLDRCLPQFLLAENRRGTNHMIIIAFFVLSVSVLFITRGDVETLAGVYTISFLSVMALFGIGNILLKTNRAKLPRPTQASLLGVLIAILFVLIGLVGNAVMEPNYLKVFAQYFIPAVLIVSIMLSRITILKGLLFMVRSIIRSLLSPMHAMTRWAKDLIERINSQEIVFFTRGDNIENLNNAMLYVRQNEHTNRLKVVTVVAKKEDAPPKLKEELEFLDEAYPEIHIEYIVLEGAFGPKLVDELSHRWRIPKNFMFIGSPGTKFKYGLAELGGVRLII